MVTPHTKLVRYEINFSRVLERRLKLGISDGKVFADGEEIFSAKGLRWVCLKIRIFYNSFILGYF